MKFSPYDPSAYLPGDQHTFLAIVELANGNDKEIQMESAVGLLTVLDLRLRITRWFRTSMQSPMIHHMPSYIEGPCP